MKTPDAKANQRQIRRPEKSEEQKMMEEAEKVHRTSP
jgi:hypothetical protein